MRLLKLMLNEGYVFKSITANNGTEFRGCPQTEKRTKSKLYFAHPYHSWERGSNENTNGLFRHYLPKGTSMTHPTQHHCKALFGQR
jgi:IS30 family transposase